MCTACCAFPLFPLTYLHAIDSSALTEIDQHALAQSACCGFI